jgi:dTDP-4-dehydrorhamnose 3,5-epimerase-like enzyme
MTTLSDATFFSISHNIDARGALSVIEVLQDIPFEIARLFYITDVKQGETRGHHAHHQCKQALICIRGACEICCDDGENKKNFLLHSTSNGLYIPPGLWAEQKYLEEGTILLILADQHYDEKDYVRNYSTFLKIRGVQ